MPLDSLRQRAIDLDLAAAPPQTDENPGGLTPTADVGYDRRRAERALMTTLAFSWGYAGWGNHTRALVDLVDRVEAARGFAPPMFVDVRIRRAVRAEGFRERAFESLLGDRYAWLPGLGNRMIVDPSLDEHVLDDPRTIAQLIDHITTRRDRRVIYFCSCPSPLERHTCHRGLVTKTLIRAARRRKLAIAAQEWPGGDPEVRSLALPTAHEKKLRSLVGKPDTWRLPLPPETSLEQAGALPHFSILDQGDHAAMSGPAFMTSRGWVMPIYAVHATLARAKSVAARDVKEFELHLLR